MGVDGFSPAGAGDLDGYLWDWRERPVLEGWVYQTEYFAALAGRGFAPDVP